MSGAGLPGSIRASSGQSGCLDASARRDGRSLPVAMLRRRLGSDALFQGERELVIVHGNKEYVLRITRQGKLILTT